MPDWRALVRDRLDSQPVDPPTLAEVSEELAQHLEDRYRDSRARGLSEADAITRTLAELQGHERLAQDLPRLRPAPSRPPLQHTSAGWGRPLLDDLRFAFRRLLHASGFTAVAILTLALAVGANTAILGVADAVLFRPLPYADPDHLFILQALDRASGQQYTLVQLAFIDAINDHHGDVSEAGLIEQGGGLVLTTPDGTESVRTAEASAGYFPILGVTPARGRVLDARDRGNEGRAAVLSYTAWQQRFGGDESIVGRSVTLGTATFDVVGVLPPGFIFPSSFVGKAEIVTLMKPAPRGSTGGTFHPIVRVAPGVSRDRAQAALDAAIAPVAATLPKHANSTVALQDVRTVLYPVGRPIMRYLLAAALLVLIIGSANLANMMLVRGRRSARDTAVRLALGASRLRLVRPFVFEALMVGLSGALVAVLVAASLFDALLRQVPRVAYGAAPVGVNGRVILMAIALGLVSTVVFGAGPAWRAARADVLALIQNRRAGDGGCSRFGHPMIAVQVALAVVLVFGAVMAGRAFIAVLRTPLGFSSTNVARVSIGMPASTTDRQAPYLRALEILGRRADVISAGAVGSMPFSGQGPDEGIRSAGSSAMTAGIIHVLPGYFEAIGIPLVRGRTLTAADVTGDPNAAIVSVSAVRALFPSGNAIGGVFDNGRGREFHVVGVVADVVQTLDRAPAPATYVIPGAATRQLTLVARLRDRRDTALVGIRRDLRASGTTTNAVATWWADDIGMQSAFRNPRFQTIVLGTFGTLALGLTALGVFSVVAFLVVSRRREMGVRLAIGASPQSLVALVVRQELVPVTLGLVAGLVVVRWVSGLAEAQLFKVDTHDPVTLATAVAVVVVSALVAAYVPARRATQVDPVQVLRAE